MHYPSDLHQQIATLQKAHNDERETNRKLTSTVETLMASHNELQKAVEGFQTELGMRDSELGALRREKYVYINIIISVCGRKSE